MLETIYGFQYFLFQNQIDVYNKYILISLSDLVSESVNELGVFGAILVLIAISYKFISAIQIVIDVLRAIVNKRTLPAMIAIVSVSVPFGFSGSNLIFIANSRYPILQNKIILFLLYIFVVEMVIAFLISKKVGIKKYSVFLGVLIISVLISAGEYNQLYLISSLLMFLVSAIHYRRLDSVSQKEYYGGLYLRMILATSFAVGASIIVNMISNINKLNNANLLLAVAVIAIIGYEFYNKIMEEIEYL